MTAFWYWQIAAMARSRQLCDSGLITDMRTAGASAVAVDALANPTQARSACRRRLTGVLARPGDWARAAPQNLEFGAADRMAKGLAERLARETNAKVQAEFLEAVAASDIVVPRLRLHPYFTEEKLSPGATVVAMGADAVGKRELGRGSLGQPR